MPCTTFHKLSTFVVLVRLVHGLVYNVLRDNYWHAKVLLGPQWGSRWVSTSPHLDLLRADGSRDALDLWVLWARGGIAQIYSRVLTVDMDEVVARQGELKQEARERAGKMRWQLVSLDWYPIRPRASPT